jgi:hypothetical protein
MRLAPILAFVLLFASPTKPQQGVTIPNKDVCLEKEMSDFTRPILADGGRMKIGFLVEHITWSDEYRRAAADVIRNQFSSNFVVADDDQTLGVLMLYISGTSVVSNGAQYVDIKLQINSSEILLPENGNNIFTDTHLAKVGDPIRSMSGYLVFAEEGVLLPSIEQGTSFELWQVLRMQTIREKVHNVLAEFVANWDKAGKK